MWETVFKKFEVIWSACLSRPYPFKFFKGFLPQTLLDPVLNALSLMYFCEISSTKNENGSTTHYVKSICIRSFFGPHFPAFGLNTERYGVSLRIQSDGEKYGPEKLRIRKLFTQWPLQERRVWMKSKCRIILNSFIQSLQQLMKTTNFEIKTGKLFGMLWLKIFAKTYIFQEFISSPL